MSEEEVICKTAEACSILKNMDKYVIFGIGFFIILISFFIWTMYKKVKKVENDIRTFQKTTNEFTNVKYMMEDITKKVVDLQQQTMSVSKKNVKEPVKEQVKEQVKAKSSHVDFKTLSKIAKSKENSVEIESVNSDDIEGEDEREIEVLEEAD